MSSQGLRRKRMSHAAFRRQFDAMLRWLSPLPPPHRRWIAATAMAEAAPDGLDTTDPAVVEAAKSLQALDSCDGDDERAAVRQRWPTISAAQAIFEGDGPRRWKLESWILTGESDREIADHCGVPPVVVAVYQELFFERRQYLDHLDKREWLAQRMYGPYMGLTFRSEELGRFWAWAALTGGPAVLSSFLTAFDAARKVDTPPTLAAYLQPGLEISSSLQATVAVHVIPTNKDTAIAWAAFRVRLIEAEAMPDPRQREVALLRLNRDVVSFAWGLLGGKSPEKLRHLLRLGKRKTVASVVLSPEAALADLIAKLKIDLPPREAGQGGAA